MEILKTVISISLLSSFLALIIVIIEKYLLNYGTCIIDVNNEEKKLEVEGGQSLLSSLAEHDILIPSACGGKATCGLCKVKVLEGAGPLLPTEEPFLNEEERNDGYRLSCQVKVKNDIKIVIPKELFSIKRFKAKVEKITDMTYDIKQFDFTFTDGQEIDFKAGQYMQIESKPYGRVKEKVIRAYSIASKPSENKGVSLIVRLVPSGVCTTFMHEHLKVNENVSLTGPYGDFYLREGANRLIFIAGGSGLAPIRSLILDIIEKKIDKEMIFFFGAGSKKDLYYDDFFNELEEKVDKFRFVAALSSPLEEDNWDGETGLITEVVKKYIKSNEDSQAYLCGSPGMLKACVNVLEGIGFDESQVFFDAFS